MPSKKKQLIVRMSAPIEDMLERVSTNIGMSKTDIMIGGLLAIAELPVEKAKQKVLQAQAANVTKVEDKPPEEPDKGLEEKNEPESSSGSDD